MQAFSYKRVDDPAGAVKTLQSSRDAQFLAGGTTLIDLMKLDVQSPTQLVDINHLPLDKIEVTPNVVRIGAMVRNSDLAYHEAIQKSFPVLSQALLSGATPQLRNVATVGGNLLQRTRCPYFRDIIWPCNKREPGSGCAALEGYNRTHAILGTSEKCIATHPSDMCVAMMALEAVITTLGPNGNRKIPISKFYVAYGDDPAKENVLEPAELITAVELTPTPWFTRSYYLKVRDRASFEFALVSVAAVLEVTDGAIRSARIALGGVATKPWPAQNAEQQLIGARPEHATFVKAAENALRDAKPYKFNSFKVELAKRAIVRALTNVAAMS
jgi:xanthine dehydrogenase YagS FAD-binding subunit